MAERDDAERAYWLALNAVRGMTPLKFQRLLGHFSSAEAIWRASPDELARVPGFERNAPLFVKRRHKIDPIGLLHRLEREDLRVLTLLDSSYPPSLRHIAVPPPVLTLKGSLLPRDEVAIALVGTRRPTDYGLMAAEKFARELAGLGFTIVSGLALGIDTAAHRGALHAKARTIAVLGSGFGYVYPPENRSLAGKIGSHGAVISEFPFDTQPSRWTFPQRNRVISGLAVGTIVVEAPTKSGAIITAEDALEQGKALFAVPGPITHPESRGANKLIRDGAKLIQSVQDVLDEYPDLQPLLSWKRRPKSGQRPVLVGDEATVFDALAFEPIHFNDVVERSGLNSAGVSYALLQLSMKSLIKELPGKRFVKLP